MNMREKLAQMKAQGFQPDINTPRGKSFAENGDYVKDQGEVIFANGAIAEDSMLDNGLTIDPPHDDWERAKIIARYWSLKAQAAVDEFNAYKSWLQGGDGRGIEGIYTEEDQLAHLAKLCVRAKSAKRQFREARAEVNANEPQYIRKLREVDDNNSQRKVSFLTKLDAIKL